MGNHRAHSPMVERGPRGESRLAVSGALSAQAPGLDRVRMEDDGEQSPRALLLVDRRGAAAAHRGASGMGASVARHPARPRHGGAMMVWTRLVAELRRLVGAMTAAREDRAMREEMRFHLDMLAANLREQGLSDAEARR